MALRDDIEDDFLLVDGLEPVTWQRLNSEGNEDAPVLSIAIEYALRRAMVKDMLFSERLITAEDRIILTGEVTRWHFQKKAIAPYTARKGDLVVDGDGVKWAVWEVDTQTFRTRYRLICVRHSQLP